MRTNMINNERGMAALLSVIVLSIIMVSTLSSFYIYIENRARFQERLRMNYQTGYVMEDMSRALGQAFEQALATPTTPCPADTGLAWLDCKQVCASDITKLTGVVPAGTPALAVCVKADSLNKIINGADYFCAFNPDGGAVAPAYCAGLAKNEEQFLKGDGAVAIASNNLNSNSDSKLEKWYSRLDSFFDTTIVKSAPIAANKILGSQIQPPTMLGWLLPETAYANGQPVGNEGHSEAAGGSQDCTTNPTYCKAETSTVTMPTIGCGAGSSDDRCKKCGAAQRKINGLPTDGSCMKVSICPPWINSRECVSGNTDKRIQQMVRVN